MKKIISLLLAVILIVSVAAVAAVSVGAEGTAQITIKSVDGKTETKVCNVGDTVTVYTYLDAGKLSYSYKDNEGVSHVVYGGIASIKGGQIYDPAVVKLNAQLDDEGLIENLATVFPVTKNGTMANGGVAGDLVFTASKPSQSSPFIFNSSECMLIVTEYEVIAPGETEIETTVETLGLADFYITKLISKGAFTDPSYANDVIIHSTFNDAGFTVSGSIKSFLDTSEVTVKLTGTDNDFIGEAKGTDSYSIGDVPAGKYEMTVSKVNHVTRTYEIEVVDADVTANVKIHPRGDITGDGLTNAADCAQVLRSVRKLENLDAYQTACGDLNNTKTVDAGDAAKMLRHLRKIEPLY